MTGSTLGRRRRALVGDGCGGDKEGGRLGVVRHRGLVRPWMSMDVRWEGRRAERTDLQPEAVDGKRQSWWADLEMGRGRISTHTVRVNSSATSPYGCPDTIALLPSATVDEDEDDDEGQE